MASLQKDLEIHKDIEDELAKRSHYSRGIIKKLTVKIAELEEAAKTSIQQRQSSNGDKQLEDDKQPNRESRA